MSPSAGDVVKRARFVFPDCDKKPITYRAIARIARFDRDIIRGRMVVQIELFADKRRGGKGSRKGSTRKK